MHTSTRLGRERGASLLLLLLGRGAWEEKERETEKVRSKILKTVSICFSSSGSFFLFIGSRFPPPLRGRRFSLFSSRQGLLRVRLLSEKTNSMSYHAAVPPRGGRTPLSTTRTNIGEHSASALASSSRSWGFLYAGPENDRNAAGKGGDAR